MNLTIHPLSFILGILAVFGIQLLLELFTILKDACSRHHFGNLSIPKDHTDNR